MNASNFAMLGLGDIVIPGIFIALLLRYDHSLNRKSHFYFYATFLGKVSIVADPRITDPDPPQKISKI